ncbi:hypothetical protein PHYBOEH_000785 [Phytophthora boehmeriae]|uniref:M96 mating-specific protein family n=1 Tax=Phytophthora boehmeriae TaxID=109152 RepID=A0A8T1V9F6_9STRA|nr:hypothetical protein PHYBOEH_000785 [Phytophthora boehmeriae]
MNKTKRTPTKPKKPTKRIRKKELNPSWLKRKSELQELRQETRELENQVAILRLKRVAEQVLQSPETDDKYRQWRTEHQAALDENVALKSKLRVVLKVSKALRNALDGARQQREELLEATRALRAELGARRDVDLGKATAFDMLEGRVDVRFQEVQDSFVGMPVLTTLPGQENVNVSYRNGGRHMQAMNYRRSQLLPFEGDTISCAIWTSVKNGGFPDDPNTRVTKRSADAYANASRLTVSLEGGTIVINMHCVFKRFASPIDTAAMGTSTAKKPKKKRRRDRNRPHHEIARLQKQVWEMETQLKALEPPSSVNVREMQVLQQENAELKAKLRESLRNAVAVEKLLKTHADKLLQALPKSLVVSGRNLVYDVAEDDAVFQVLARAVDHHYMEVNHVLREAGLDDSTVEIFDAHLSESEQVLKLRTCSFLPYPHELVVQAMAHRMECEAAILPGNVTSMRDLGLPIGSASSLIVSKREVHLDNESFTIRLALKEFVEADRVVYVWDAIGDWPQEETTSHVSTREYGWCYFVPMGCPGLSVFRSFALVSPTIVSDEATTADAKLVERVMRLYRHTIESRYQKLENALVDASMQSRGSPSAVAL